MFNSNDKHASAHDNKVDPRNVPNSRYTPLLLSNLINSLINKKYKVPLSDEFSYFSNYTKVFHYDDERKVINSIKDTLKEIDEKFSDKRSQIRNS